MTKIFGHPAVFYFGVTRLDFLVTRQLIGFLHNSLTHNYSTLFKIVHLVILKSTKALINRDIRFISQTPVPPSCASSS